MKKIFRIPLCIFLIFVMIFTFCSCLSSVIVNNSGNELEREAQTKFEEYLSANYEKYKILSKHQIVWGGFLEGKTETNYVFFNVKLDNNEYEFVYDNDTDVVCSNVNYDKIVSELKNKLNEKDFMSMIDNTDITICSFEYHEFDGLINDEHKNLEDVLNYNNKEFYLFEIHLSTVKREPIKPEDVQIKDWFDLMPTLDFTLYNYYSKSIPDITTDEIEMFYDTESNKINTKYEHKKIIKLEDGLFFGYDDNFCDVKITKKKTPDQRPDSSYYQSYEFHPISDTYIVTTNFKQSDLQDINEYISKDTESEIVTVKRFWQLGIYTSSEYEGKFLYEDQTKNLDKLVYFDYDYIESTIRVEDGETVRFAFYNGFKSE